MLEFILALNISQHALDISKASISNFCLYVFDLIGIKKIFLICPEPDDIMFNLP